MTHNIGSIDRFLRIAIGLGLAALVVAGTITPWALLVSGVLIATALMRFCPAYRILGLRTCRASE
ncbi:YgaP family membrane protein [Hyphomicrobium sp.]|uniref:YgaP family membrane protein n=1 Tax=Hyphomicrobium sp. TaxID=82 RepID=UPI002FE35EB3